MTTVVIYAVLYNVVLWKYVCGYLWVYGGGKNGGLNILVKKILSYLCPLIAMERILRVVKSCNLSILLVLLVLVSKKAFVKRSFI